MSTLESVRGSWSHWHSVDQPLRLGVSSCLMGESVRHDAGHCRDRFVTDVLSQWVEWVPVCPEVEIGMGVPRPTVRLVDDDSGELQMFAPKTGEDFGPRMRAFSEQRIRQLDQLGLDGYVLKKSSPSCGMERVRVYRGTSILHKNGSGLFAAALKQLVPGLPLEEEGRLNDPPLRDNFIERVFCRNRWRALVRRGLRRGRLVEFHTAHKLVLRAHDETGYRELGTLVGTAKKTPDAELFARYEATFQRTLERKTTTRKHTNVLQHALGYLKKVLDPSDKREVASAVEDYRQGLVPLIVPITLLGYLVRKHEIEYLQGQLYFDPHPKELMLRNHV